MLSLSQPNFMKKVFVGLFLAAASAAHALSILVPGGTLIVGPFDDREPVTVVAGATLLLDKPGTYTAPSWNISGELRLGAPGNYIVVASSGGIVMNLGAKLSGQPISLPVAIRPVPAQVTFVAATGLQFSGTTEGNVTISQGLPVGASEPPPLVNISTRSTLSAGQNLISGFVVGGKIARTILIRAIGPTLSTFNITNPLATPTLTVSNGQTKQSWTNSGWATSPLSAVTLSTVFTSVGAFGLPTTSRDAALLLVLSPGSYTVQINGGAGEVLTEIYYVDPSAVPTPEIVPGLISIDPTL